MNIRILAGLVLTTSVCADGMGSSPFGSGGKARLTFAVVDEEGQPVVDAVVNGYFWSPLAREYVGSVFTIQTDKHGLAIAKGRAFSFIEGTVKCDKHYRTEFKLKYPGQLTTLRSFHNPTPWSDWVATNAVVLKGIRNPVPMYVKEVMIKIPKERATLAYDLLVGDWVAPIGRGANTDMVLNVSAEYRSETNRKIALNVVWPGKWNGAAVAHASVNEQGQPISGLMSDHYAPQTGYFSELTFHRSRSPDTIVNPYRTEPGALFYFRVRSTVDDHGRLKEAMYGKIYRHIVIDFDEYRPNRLRNIVIRFTYYLNPDGTRNVEFNPERNLFPTGKRDGKFAP